MKFNHAIFTLIVTLLSFISVFAGGTPNCNAEGWSSRTSYKEVGTQITYEGKVYENKWYTKGDEPGSDDSGPWRLLAFCDNTVLKCDGIDEYDVLKIYKEKGTQVVYNGKLYHNLWYTKGKDPESSDVWIFDGPCSGGATANAITSNNSAAGKRTPIFAKPYPYGIMPTNAKMSDVKEAYDKWKVKYVTSQGCPAGKRVLFDDMKSTVSEGMAYGLIVAGYMKDQELFDDLYRYYRSYPDPWDMMHWKIDENGKRVGDNAATDADEDVAFMLLIAHHNFGSNGSINYMQEAHRIIKLMMAHMVEKETYILKPGDAWGGSLNTNICYYVPAYYKIFAHVTGDQDWIKVADKCYEIIFKAWNPSTGLVPDWCQGDGSLPALNGGKPLDWAKNQGRTYYYDATRTPWRIAKDYLWFGDKRALMYCNTVTEFVKKDGGFAAIKDGYNLDGTKFSHKHTSAFVGPFAVGAMASTTASQQFVNEGYTENVNTFNDVYYNDMMRLIVLMNQTGLYNIPDEYKGL